MKLPTLLLLCVVVGLVFPTGALVPMCQHPLRPSLSNKGNPFQRGNSLLCQTHNTEVEKADRELLNLSFFSFLHSAAMPFGDLVDASFLSTMDANSLGAVGVVRAAQNSVSKLYNSPLSKTTISLISSASGEAEQDHDEEKLATAVSSALLFSVLLGTLQAIVFVLGAKPILHAAGIDSTSDMYAPATAYMKARALSSPTATLWLVSNNVFRGLGDATTPMLCAFLFNFVNFVGDYVLVEKVKVGIVGVAFGTNLGQIFALVPLLLVLNKKVSYWMKASFRSFGSYITQYGRAGVFLMGRSIARVAAVSYCSRRAFGPIAASSYSVLYQIGMWVTILSDGVSIATQSVLSRHYRQRGQEAMALSRHVIRRSFQLGLSAVAAISMLLYAGRSNVISILTKRPEIQAAALQAFPMFLLAQGLAFPVNGILLGGMDWGFAMWCMGLANLACIASFRFIEHSARGLWAAWATYYLAQALFGILRFMSKTGEWKRLRVE